MFYLNTFKIMRNKIILFFFLFCVNLFAQKSTDKLAHVVNIYQTNGNIFIQFNVTFDNATKQDNCTNNIHIINNSNYHYYLEFKLLLDGEEIYNGYADLYSKQSGYLNDAFYDCKSSYKKCEIRIFKLKKYERN